MSALQPSQRLTAYAFIRDAAGRVLLARAGAGTDAAGTWFLPGGGVEHGEHPDTTAIRETAEETGLTIALDGLLRVASEDWELPHKGVHLHSVRLIYAGHVVGGTLRCEIDGTTDAVRWVSQAEAQGLPLMAFVAEALEMKHFRPCGGATPPLSGREVLALGAAVRHQPAVYLCPFCVLSAYGNTERSEQRHIVERTAETLTLVSPRFWPRNKGHVIVVPAEHHENLYMLPDHLGAAVHRAVRRAAIALKRAYECDGTSTRQHNEPAGNQDVWHYHVHVLPRYEGDDLYRSAPGGWLDTDEMARYATRLRQVLAPGSDDEEGGVPDRRWLA